MKKLLIVACLLGTLFAQAQRLTFDGTRTVYETSGTRLYAQTSSVFFQHDTVRNEILLRLDGRDAYRGRLSDLTVVGASTNTQKISTILAALRAAGAGSGGGGGGDASAANQIITNSTLSTINGKLPALSGGRVPVDVSFPTAQSINFPNGSSVAGTAGLSVLNTDLLTNTVNGWYDAAAFQSGTVQIIASAGISAGAVFFEQTNDNASTSGIPLLAHEVNVTNANPQSAAITIAASANRIFRFGINARYIRVRISTAFVGGTVQAIAFFSEFPYSSPLINVQQATAGNLLATVSATNLSTNISQINGVTPLMGAGNTGTGSLRVTLATDQTSNTNPLLVRIATPAAATAEASSAKTTSGAGATLTNADGRGAVFFINVSAVSGTTPTLQLRLQAQDPVTSNWFDVPNATSATLSTVTTSTFLVYPGVVNIAGSSIPISLPRTYRIAWTIGGTTPSFTFSVGVQPLL